VGTDASVQGGYWYDGQPWQRYQLAPAGSASVKGDIAAVSRIPNSMEVWWVGTDASVQGAYWYGTDDTIGVLRFPPPPLKEKVPPFPPRDPGQQ
jgi:hypothetical protein